MEQEIQEILKIEKRFWFWFHSFLFKENSFKQSPSEGWYSGKLLGSP